MRIIYGKSAYETNEAWIKPYLIGWSLYFKVNGEKNDLFTKYNLWKRRKCYKKIFGTPNGKRVFKIIKGQEDHYDK